MLADIFASRRRRRPTQMSYATPIFQPMPPPPLFLLADIYGRPPHIYGRLRYIDFHDTTRRH
jgi:hypothetical protein